MSRTSKDNFSKSTIEALKKRVSNFCSNPNCKKLTHAPKETEINKVNETGIAAHIYAAADGGPRANLEMTSEQRSNIENGIWLCSTCSILIDKEANAYPAELLKQWKSLAENRIKKNLNKKFNTEIETNQLVQKKILNAKGIGNDLAMSNSLSEIARSINEYFYELDSRLNINYSYVGEVNYYNIEANENSIDDPVCFNIVPVDFDEFNDNIKKLQDHGGDFSCEINSIKSDSLALIDLFPRDFIDGVVTIKSHKLLNLLVDIEDENENVIGTFNSELKYGRKSFSLYGNSLNNLLNLNYTSIESEQFRKNNLTVHFDMNEWDRVDLRDLKYFDKIYKFYKKVFLSKSLYIKAYLEGKVILEDKLLDVDLHLKGLMMLLDLLHYSRELCKIFNHQSYFDIKLKIDNNCYMQIVNIYNKFKEHSGQKDFEFYVGVALMNKFPEYIKNGESEICVEQKIDFNNFDILGSVYSGTIFLCHYFNNPLIELIKFEDKDEIKYKLKLSPKDSSSYYDKKVNFSPTYKNI